MMGLKQWVKNGLVGWQQWKYGRLLEKKAVSYDSWIKRVETEKYGGNQDYAGGTVSVRQVPYGVCRDYLTHGAVWADVADVVLFVGENGRVNDIAEKVTEDYFGRNGDVDMAYGDEDVMGPDGIRYTPWLKPHWSPDTFLSFFYFGNVFAVRRKALLALTEEEMRWIWQDGGECGDGCEKGCGNGAGDEGEMGGSGSGVPGRDVDVGTGIYRLCYVIAVKSGGFLVRGSGAEGGGLLTRDGGVKDGGFLAGDNDIRDDGVKGSGLLARDGGVKGDGRLAGDRGINGGGFGLPVGHMDEVLFHAKGNCEIGFVRSLPLDRAGCPAGAAEGGGGCGQCIGPKISIVIPSKDNAEVLKRCIRSVLAQYRERRGALDCEIIVVDNGSAREVRGDLEKWLAGVGNVGCLDGEDGEDSGIDDGIDGDKGKRGCVGLGGEGDSGRQGIGTRYIYREMPFHFSEMCNMGAEAATGEVLLFLNDDVEMAGNGGSGQECLLERFYGRAKRGFTGAVGVKLYYPGSNRIQHAGIVNLRLGPVHKLQFKEDGTDYYYGWNRRERNVVAVTGACLAVAREKFWEAGGFPAELPVAFNDVDLCFTLWERGYYNVVLQDVVLYHYESMSRGNDDGREKLNRLLGERDKLYTRHPRMYGTDPFYHKYLAGDMLSTGFELRADYDWHPQLAFGKVRAERGLVGNAREDACVMVSLEYAGPVNGFLEGETGEGKKDGADAVGAAEGRGVSDAVRMAEGSGVSGAVGAAEGIGVSDAVGAAEGIGVADAARMAEEMGMASAGGKDGKYLLQGYSFVAGSDNACFEKYLIFRQETAEGDGSTVLSVKAEPFIRRDVETNLPDQINVGMAGFCMLIGEGDLPMGTYRVGVMVRDMCSGQKLYTWTNRYLVYG